MKRILLFAVAALTFAACSENNDLAQPNQQTAADPGAVAFEAYTQRATTRGGWPGVLTTNTPNTVMLTEKGFGVFAYYTDNNDYDQRSVPNFMFNQKVTYEGSAWTYNPVVYWPNEYGDDAKSDDTDRVTFFAYAPYVDVTPTTGKLKTVTNGEDTWGIVQMNRNNAQGDPLIKYIASFNSKKSVDLAWGVCNDPSWALVEGHGTQNFTPGKPWIDVKRPALTTTDAPAEYQKVKFNFRHALAQMQVYIDADIDAKGHSSVDNYVDKKTRVWVREITFKGFVMKGTLNLNNDNANQPYWLDYNGQNDIVAEDVTVYDQRKDGKEGVAGAVATNEKVGGLNPCLIQNEPYKPSAGSSSVYEKGKGLDNKSGVPETPVTLFDNNTYDSDGNPEPPAGNGIFHVIPVEGEDFYVEIVYDIETVDQNLAQNLSDGATKGSSIENRIRQEKIEFTGGEKSLKAGHSYRLNIHLGLNSVKFDAEVTPWIEEAIQDIDLPSNAPQYAANTSDGTSKLGQAAAAAAGDLGPYEVTIPYTGEYIFALTGLNGGETVTGAKTGSYDPKWSATSNPANGSGIAIQTINTAGLANTLTTDYTEAWNWKGNQNGHITYFNFTQQAHPLFFQIIGFAIPDADKKQSTITIQRNNDALHNNQDHWTVATGWICDGDGNALTEYTTTTNYVKVWRNGVLLERVGTAETADNALNNKKFFIQDEGASDKNTNTITIGDQLQAGDVIQVEIKTGDAPAETVTATVGGIYYAPASRTVVYRASETYDITPLYVGANTPASYTYASSNDDVVDTTPSSSSVTVKQSGQTIITASFTSTDPSFDAVKNAKLTLNVIKQNSQIKDETMKTETITAGVTSTANSEVMGAKKAHGSIDTEAVAGDVTPVVTSATKNGVSIATATFKVEDKKVLVNTPLDVGNTYTVTIKGTFAGDEKYNGCEKTVTYTFDAKSGS